MKKHVSRAAHPGAASKRTCAGEARLIVTTVLGMLLLSTAVHAQDNAQPAPPPPAPATQPDNATTPPPPTDQNQQGTYQNGVPSGQSDNTVVVEQPQQPRHHGLVIGINAGVFSPSSGKTRSRFGNTWFSTGIGLGSIPRVSGHGIWDLDLRTQYQASDNDRHVFVGNLGVEYRRRFDPSKAGGEGQFVPYYGASADAVFVDISSPEDDVHSGVNVVPGGSVFIGSNIGGQEFIQANYDGVSSVKGFNFSGFDLEAGVRFY